MILILDLLIFWATTWVLIQLDTFSGLLWVVGAEVALFRSFFHINAARKLAVGHSMRCSSFPLDIFESLSFFYVHDARPYH